VTVGCIVIVLVVVSDVVVVSNSVTSEAVSAANQITRLSLKFDPARNDFPKHALSVTKLAVSVCVVVSVTKSSVLVTVLGSAVLVET
jgi:hypothetical protein